jgi:hypothetical protein
MSAPTTDDLDLFDLRYRRASIGGMLARARESREPDPAKLLTLEQNLLEAMLLEHAAKWLAKYPTLRPEQCDRLDAFFRARVAP